MRTAAKAHGVCITTLLSVLLAASRKTDRQRGSDSVSLLIDELFIQKNRSRDFYMEEESRERRRNNIHRGKGVFNIKLFISVSLLMCLPDCVYLHHSAK